MSITKLAHAGHCSRKHEAGEPWRTTLRCGGLFDLYSCPCSLCHSAMRRLASTLILYLFFVQITVWGQSPDKTPAVKENSQCPLAESLEGFALHLMLQVELYNLEATDGSLPDPALKEKLKQACLSQLDWLEALVSSRSMKRLLGVDYQSVSGRAETDARLRISLALQSLRHGSDPFEITTGLIKENGSGTLILASENIQFVVQTVKECRQQFVTLKARFAPQPPTAK